jgi:hypothetical protein
VIPPLGFGWRRVMNIYFPNSRSASPAELDESEKNAAIMDERKMLKEYVLFSAERTEKNSWFQTGSHEVRGFAPPRLNQFTQQPA